MKAADISDATFLDAVRRCGGGRWAMEWEVTADLGFPRKVVLAKAKRLIRRGAMVGCWCGCRGDWTAKEE